MFEGIKMPKLSETSDEYKVIKIYKNVGDQLKRGEIIMDVETDKSAMTVTSFYTGKITEMNAKEGDSIRYNSLLGVVDTVE